MISVFIVDDSETARRTLRRALEKSPDLSVVGEAATSEEAMLLIPRLDPQIVTMDVHLGRESGIQLTERIMVECPRPVIIVTGINPTDPKLAYQALEAGALEVVGKLPAPNRREYPARHRQLVRLVTSLAAVPVVTRRRADRRWAEPTTTPSSPHYPHGTRLSTPLTSEIKNPQGVVSAPIRIVVVGASTGGPPALAELLGSLPRPLPWPVVVVQHIANGFEKGFAKWLGNVTKHRVLLVDKPLQLAPDRIYVACGNRHAALSNAEWVRPDDGPPDYFRPSADVLFRSVAKHLSKGAIAILLTGMGADGTLGFAAMKEAGAITIVQSPETCVVASMPQAAINAGAVDRVGSIAEIAQWLLRFERHMQNNTENF